MSLCQGCLRLTNPGQLSCQKFVNSSLKICTSIEEPALSSSKEKMTNKTWAFNMMLLCRAKRHSIEKKTKKHGCQVDLSSEIPHDTLQDGVA